MKNLRRKYVSPCRVMCHEVYRALTVARRRFYSHLSSHTRECGRRDGSSLKSKTGTGLFTGRVTSRKMGRVGVNRSDPTREI